MAQQIIIKGTPVVAANEVLVADSNSKIPAVDGSAVTTMAGGNITGTIPTARLDTGTTANKLVVVGATGLPAVDGSLLTGIVSHTTSASDPTITTNPSGGVGSEWINSTSGKQFICTDATAGENVWTCSGGGSGNIQPWTFGGSNYGYHMHTVGPWGTGTLHRGIDKYSYTSDANAIDVGDQLAFTGGFTHSGTQGVTHGYCIGGANWPPTTNLNRIEKVSFATDGDAVDVGDLLAAIHGQSGNTSPDKSYGYCAGGHNGSVVINTIQKWSHVTDGNSTDVADILQAAYHCGSADSATHGYVMGHATGGTYQNAIQKWNYSTDANSTDVSNLIIGGGTESSNNDTHVLICRNQANIDKFVFATEVDAVDSGGDLTIARSAGSSSSSLTYGYVAGGHPIAGGYVNTISKFSFAISSGTDTDVGDLNHPTGDRPGGFHY
jgi:hypothetical protein